MTLPSFLIDMHRCAGCPRGGSGRLAVEINPAMATLAPASATRKPHSGRFFNFPKRRFRCLQLRPFKSSHDVMGRMLSREVSTDPGPTTFVWDGMDCVQETAPAGVVTRYNVVNGVLMSFVRDGLANAYYDSAHYDTDHYSGTIACWIQADATGNVRTVTGDGGNVVANYDFDAWGNPLPSTNDGVPNGGLAYRFVGALGVRYDDVTGMYDMRQRWYDPMLQRFLSRDPLRTVNRYWYAWNNPVRFVDPSGLKIYVASSDVLGGNPTPGDSERHFPNWCYIVRC